MKTFPLLAPAGLPLGIPISSSGDGVSGPDLRSVTGATMSVLKPDRVTILTWIPSVVAAPGQVAITATDAMLRYTFTGTELDAEGVWRVSWKLTLTGGTTWPMAPEDSTVFLVTDQFGLT